MIPTERKKGEKIVQRDNREDRERQGAKDWQSRERVKIKINRVRDVYVLYRFMRANVVGGGGGRGLKCKVT
jgi:hypothetical protein